MSNVATLEQPKRSVLVSMSADYGMEPAAFEATLRATVVPSNTSKEQFAAFLLVAKQYGLNPVTKEIYAFPTKGGGIQPIVGIDGWMNLINSHPSCDGLEFKDDFNDAGELVAITAILYRKDRKHPTMVTEYMAECKRQTEPWTKWPARMLRHKAAIQCARYAFGFAGIIDPEEAERSPEVITETVAPPPPPAIAAPDTEAVDVVADEEFDVEAYITNLYADLESAKTAELVEEVWDAADVQRKLTGMDDRLADAFTMKQQRLEAIER